MALGSCPNCGAPVAQTWKICPSCGTELDAGKREREEQEKKEKEKKEEEERLRKEQELKEQKLREEREAAEAAAKAEAERIARMTPEERARIKAEEEARIREKQRKQVMTVFLIVAAISLVAGGIIAFRLTNRPVNERLARVDKFISANNYPLALAECEKVFGNGKPLGSDQLFRLVKDYRQLSSQQDKAISETAGARYWSILSAVVEQEKAESAESSLSGEYISTSSILSDLEKECPDDIVSLRLSKAQSFFDKGKLGDAKTVCDKIFENSSSLTFEHKCALASLFAALGEKGDDVVSRSRGALLYNQAVTFDEPAAKAIFEKDDARYGINIGEIAKSVKTAASASGVSSSQFAKSVVVTGVNVRLRRGPSLESDTVKDFYGKNVHPDKGEYLEYIGQSGDFYKVRYKGEEVYISKDFTSIVQ